MPRRKHAGQSRLTRETDQSSDPIAMLSTTMTQLGQMAVSTERMLQQEDVADPLACITLQELQQIDRAIEMIRERCAATCTCRSDQTPTTRSNAQVATRRCGLFCRYRLVRVLQ